MSQGFDVFFEQATGVAPYTYQRRLAEEDSGRPCASLRIHVPAIPGAQDRRCREVEPGIRHT